MAPNNRTQLTPEQMARFNMPYQDVLRQQWNQIPEVVEKATPSPNDNVLVGMISNVGGFFENVGSYVADTFSNFGLGIKDTITMLVFLLLSLVLLYFVMRLIILQRKNKK